MTCEQVLDIIAPHKHDVDCVISWLRVNGVKSIKNFGDALEVVTDVQHAAVLFSTTFHTFFHESGRKIVRINGAMSIPHELSTIVEMVEGISNFPVSHLKAHVFAPKDGQQGVVPETLNMIYQVPAETNGAAPGTSVGVIEFEGQNFDPADLANFATQSGITVTPLTKAHIVGPNDPTSPQIEATLDIEMVCTMDDAAVAWFWLEADDNWLLQFGTHFFATKTVPQVVSISYGWSEADQCDIDANECQQLGINSQQYVTRVNTEFQKIGVRGTSIIVASGDSGANGRTDPDCTLSYLKPDYPAASPYVTAVGATQLNNPVYKLKNAPPVCSGQGYSCPSGGTEVAVSYDVANFASGGGFSNYAPMPSYQSAAVGAYLSGGASLPPASYFNATNRGYPDVAAIGTAVLIYQQGVQSVGGTSCSAPEFAGIAAILNQASIKKSGSALGFLNPFLYQAFAASPANFHDITVGDNKCTEDGCSSSCEGFVCAPGWDPVTGLGSPNTAALLKYINNGM